MKDELNRIDSNTELIKAFETVLTYLRSHKLWSIAGQLRMYYEEVIK